MLFLYIILSYLNRLCDIDVGNRSSPVESVQALYVESSHAWKNAQSQKDILNASVGRCTQHSRQLPPRKQVDVSDSCIHGQPPTSLRGEMAFSKNGLHLFNAVLFYLDTWWTLSVPNDSVKTQIEPECFPYKEEKEQNGMFVTRVTGKWHVCWGRFTRGQACSRRQKRGDMQRGPRGPKLCLLQQFSPLHWQATQSRSGTGEIPFSQFLVGFNNLLKAFLFM